MCRRVYSQSGKWWLARQGFGGVSLGIFSTKAVQSIPFVSFVPVSLFNIEQVVFELRGLILCNWSRKCAHHPLITFTVCTRSCQGLPTVSPAACSTVFGALWWPDLSVFRVMLKCSLVSRSGGWTWRRAAEVTEMAGLSGLIYSWVVNTEAQTIGIFSSFSHRRMPVLMGNVFEMPTFVLSPHDSTWIRRRSLQTLSLVDHLYFSQCAELNRPPSGWSVAAAHHPLHDLWPKHRENRNNSQKRRQGLIEKRQLLWGINKKSYSCSLLHFIYFYWLMHVLRTLWDILHNSE